MLQTTGIGSLPFKDHATAKVHISKNYTLPFFPQLIDDITAQTSRLAQLPPMVAEILPRTAGLQIGDEVEDFFKKTDFVQAAGRLLEHWPGLKNFLTTGQGQKKLQLVGPITLAKCLSKKFSNLPFSDALQQQTTHWCQELIWHLETMIAGPNLIIILDEPLLTGLEKKYILTTKRSATTLGVHCCQPITLDHINAWFQGFWLSIDVTLPTFNPTKLPKQQKLIAGIVPTKHSAAPTDGILERILRHLDSPWENLILSPTCGTGLLTIAEEQQICERLTELANFHKGPALML